MIGARSQAFASGLVDGSDWDLDGYDSVEEALADDPGSWSTATINAVGSGACASAWGVAVAEGAAWELACDEYDQGVKAALAERLQDTAEYIREATEEETIESIESARTDGGTGVIVVDGKHCYVEGGEVEYDDR